MFHKEEGMLPSASAHWTKEIKKKKKKKSIYSYRGEAQSHKMSFHTKSFTWGKTALRSIPFYYAIAQTLISNKEANHTPSLT